MLITSRSRSLYFILLLIINKAVLATPVVEIIIKEHLFYPSQVEIPSDTKVKLVIHNQDTTAEEFESFELNREKVIPAGVKGVIFIGPLPAGEYPFFGEFFPNTARGQIIAK